MSKLEKALEKARADRKNQLTVVEVTPRADTAQEPNNVKEVASTSNVTDLELRETKTREIALMNDHNLLSEGELALRRIIHSDMENGKIQL